MVDGWSKFRATIALLLPLGSSGVSAALASTTESVSLPAERDVAQAQDVASKLQAIREVVSSVEVDDLRSASGEGRIEKAWWGNWHRGGWNRGGWGWRGGGWGWRNGGWGWHNGGGPNWHNGGWGNGWRNW